MVNQANKILNFNSQELYGISNYKWVFSDLEIEELLLNMSSRIKLKFEKAIIYCDENEPIYKLKIYTKKNSSSLVYKLDLPELDLSEPLYNLIEYVGNSISKNKNSIFSKNFNLDITKVLEKI